MNDIVRKAFDAKGYPEPEKDLILDPKQSRVHTSFYAQADPVGANQAATAKVREGYNNKGYPQPEKVLVLDPKIARTHSTFYAQADPVGANQAATATVRKEFNKDGYPQPEKVLVLDPKIARTHSTFYAQNLAQEEPAKAEEKPGINQQMTAAIKYTTAGYGGAGLPAAPEKDLIEDPKIARRSTTFYA